MERLAEIARGRRVTTLTLYRSALEDGMYTITRRMFDNSHSDLLDVFDLGDGKWRIQLPFGVSSVYDHFPANVEVTIKDAGRALIAAGWGGPDYLLTIRVVRQTWDEHIREVLGKEHEDAQTDA